MPTLKLIGSHDIERWETGVSDDAPGTLTDVTISTDASIVQASFETSSPRLEQGVAGTFLEPIHFGRDRNRAITQFRVSSVFTSEDAQQFYALSNEDQIFALGFRGAPPASGGKLTLRTPDRKALRRAKSNEEDALICFTPSALILCENGPKPAGNILPGDKVRTADRGLQEVRWCGKTALTPEQLSTSPHLRPVNLRKNSIAAGVPARDIAVSPNHKILINNWRAELLFGEKEVLVPAGAMVNENTISRCTDEGPVDYVHLKFIRHEILFANGMKTESFHPTSPTISALTDPDREALFAAFPALRSEPRAASGPAARRLLKATETKLLFENTGR